MNACAGMAPLAVPVCTAASVMAWPAPPPHHSSAVRFSAKKPGIVSAQPSWLIVTGARR
jgi:hypothetical protein